MSMPADPRFSPYSGLPDPDREADAYGDIPGKRAVAWLIDSVLIAVLTLVAIPFTAFTAIFYMPLLWLVVGLAYRILTLAGGSATPGMRLMAIEFRTHAGQRFGLAEASIHTLLYTLCVSMVLPQLISIGTILTTPRRQSLPDLLLGTAALNRSR